MGVEVPSNPINRKEQYLAKIAGQAVEVPAEPLTREEAYLDEIAKNGSGGGGTTNYNLLSNKPQIAGTELQGNKSLADLGIASASDLAAKQNALTAGDYVVIKNNKISVSKLKQGELDLYSYEFVTTDTSHTPKVKVVKKVNGETISETVYDEFQAANWMTFDDIIRFRYDASDSYKWKYQCLVTSNEHTKDTVVSWFWNQAVDYTETFDVGASAITDLVTKGDMNDALATKQDKLTFDNVPTQNSTNPVKSNGIYDSEKDIYAAMGEMGAKNLLYFPYDDPDGTVSHNVTYTVNNDGTVSAIGKCDNDDASIFFFDKYSTDQMWLKPGKYIFSGAPEGNTEGYIWCRIYHNDNTNTLYSATAGSFIFDVVDTDINIRCGIAFNKNTGDDNISRLFKPMLRLASDTDDTYQPYAKTNKQLTDDVALLDSKKADTDMVAADFNAGTSYTAGNYCIYEGKFYKFKNNHSGAWSSADVDEVKITGELSALKSGLASKAKVCIINVPAEKADVNGFLGYILASIIEEQEIGTYIVSGAWDNHDYYTGVVYKIDAILAMGMIEYGTPDQNMALYSASYKTGVYSNYKTVQFIS